MRILKQMPASMKSGSGRSLTICIEFLTTAYLMRVLGPEPFGLVAMATSVVVVIQVLAGGGIGASLVSDKSAEPERVGAVMLLSALAALLVTVVGIAVTPWIVAFYQEPKVEIIWIISCIIVGVSAITSVPTALAQRQHWFGLLAWSYVPVNLLAAGGSMLLLEQRHDFWPIVMYRAIVAVLGLCFIWVLVRPVVKIPNKDDIRAVMSFGVGVTTFSFLNMIQRNGDDVIVGRFLGSHNLGLYNFAYKILAFPLREIGGLVDNLAYPRLSAYMPDTYRVGAGLSEVVRETALFSTPFCIGVALAAEELISAAFGRQWEAAYFPLVVLSLLGVVQVPASRLGLAFVVSRKTGTMAKWALFSTPVVVLSFFAGIPWGINGVVLCYALTSLALMLPWVRVCALVLEYPPWEMAKPFLYGLLQGGGVSIPLSLVYLLSSMSGMTDVFVLLATIITGMISLGFLYFRIVRIRQNKVALW